MKRNRFILILLFLAAYVYAANVGGTISYLVLYLVLFVPILSACYLLYVYFRFSIYQHLERKVMVKGDHIDYEFQLVNEDFLAFTDVRVTFAKQTSNVEDISPETNYCLLPGEAEKKNTTLCCRYRGQYPVGIDYVIIRDCFHLFEVKYSYKDRIEVQVLPRVLHLDNLAIGPNEENLKTNLRGEANKQVIRDNELRKYQSGDSMKLIHWKATARTRTLLCQKYIDEPKTELMTLFDLREPDAGDMDTIIIEDKIIEAVLAINDYFCTHSIPSKVLFADLIVSIKNINTRKDFEEFYSTCKSIRFRSEYAFPELVKQAVTVSRDTRYYILITANLDDVLCIACNEVVQYGMDITILYIGDKDISRQQSELSEKIHLYVIGLDMEVEDILTNRRKKP